MPFLKWVIGGTIGGVIGAVIWIVIGYATGYEVAWIALGVGFLVGIGVRIGAGEESDGVFPGATACAIAIGTVVAAKWVVVALLVSNALAEIGEYRVTDPNMMIAARAGEIAEEIEQSGNTVQWPRERDSDYAPLAMQYPRRIWARAKKEWDEKTAQQQAAEIAAHEAKMNELLSGMAGEVRGHAFSESFGPFDALWFGLAAFTALKLGAGSSGSND